MVADPPARRYRIAAPHLTPAKLVCFRAGSWRVGLTVDEVQGMFMSVPMIPSANPRFAGEIQLPLGRVPVVDLRRSTGQHTQPGHLLEMVAIVNSDENPVALAFDLADEVIAVNPRAWLYYDLDVAPLPARARTVTRLGDVFWLDVQNVLAAQKL